MKKNVTIIDYGSGNILSAKQSFAKVIKTNNIDASVCISGDPNVLKQSTHIVLLVKGLLRHVLVGLKIFQVCSKS